MTEDSSFEDAVSFIPDPASESVASTPPDSPVRDPPPPRTLREQLAQVHELPPPAAPTRELPPHEHRAIESDLNTLRDRHRINLPGQARDYESETLVPERTGPWAVMDPLQSPPPPEENQIVRGLADGEILMNFRLALTCMIRDLGGIVSTAGREFRRYRIRYHIEALQLQVSARNLDLEDILCDLYRQFGHRRMT